MKYYDAIWTVNYVDTIHINHATIESLLDQVAALIKQWNDNEINEIEISNCLCVECMTK